MDSKSQGLQFQVIKTFLFGISNDSGRADFKNQQEYQLYQLKPQAEVLRPRKKYVVLPVFMALA